MPVLPASRGRRSPLALLGAAALAAAVLPALVAPAQAVAPVTPTFTAAIEAPADYDGQTICSPSPKPGTAKLARLLVATYGSASIGISRPCSDGGTSEHKEGRALDWMLSYKVPAQRAKVQAFLAWLLAPDQFGNKAAMARRLGVMYMGWNNQMWRSYGTMGWGDLKGCTTNPAMKASSYDTTCHRNHLHISLSWDGAAALTSFWTGSVLAPSCQAPWSGASAAAGAGARFVPVTPVRVADTQTGAGLDAACRLAAPPSWDPTRHDLVLGVTGVGEVPATGVAAVALRVSALRPSSPPETIWARTTATSTPVAAATITGSVTVASTLVLPVASDGTVRLFVSRGSADLRAEVIGYVPLAPAAPAPAPGTGSVHAMTSTVLYDGSTSPLAPGESRTVHLAGVGPVPGTGLSALSLTLMTSATATSDLVTVRPVGSSSSQGFLRTSTTRSRVGQAIVPTTTGDVIVANGGTSPVTVRLASSGYLTTDPTAGGATLTTLAGPRKVVESARSLGIPPITTSAAQTFAVAGPGTSVPAGARAVLVSVSATGGTRDGLLTIGPVGSSRPIQVLSLIARTAASDTALVPVGADGRLSIASSSVGASVRIVVVGYAA
jgi:hypothetical protein